MERTETLTTWVRVVIAAALAITLGTFIGGGTPTGVAQAAIGLTTFEIDGNTSVNTVGNVDWATAATAPNIYGYENRTDPCAGGGSEASAAVGKLDPGGSDPGLFPDAPVVGSEPVNDKSDLCAAAQALELVQVSATEYDTVFYGSFNRVNNPGEFSVFYMLRGTDTTSRLDDRLLEFNYDSSGPNTTLAIQQFDEAANEWLRVGSLSAAGPYLFQQGVVEATVDAALPSFGEFAVNLDALASIFPEDECAAFSAGSVVTRTGGENGAGELQDFVGFEPTPITNCAAVRITKDASPADLDPAAAFGYELADDINTYTGTLTVPGGETVLRTDVVASPDFALEETSADPIWANTRIVCQSYDPIAKAWEVNSYDPSAGETAPLFPIAPAYTLIGAPAPIPGDGIDVPAIGTGETAACIIVNRASAITIEKIGDGNQADFGFTHPGVGTGSSTIALNSSGDTELVAPGTYTITEDAAPDASWDLTDVFCYSGDDSVSIADGDVGLRSVTVEVGQGESVTCRFENVQDSTLLVQKTGDGTAASQFGFDTDGDPATAEFTAELNGAPVEVATVNGGQSASISEIVPDGWQLGSVICQTTSGTNSQQTSTWDIPGTAADVDIDVAAGETVLCTFDNTENGTIIVDKSATAARPTDSFTFSSADVPALPGTGLDAIADNGDELVVSVVPGTYTVSEDANADFDLTQIICSDTDSTGNPATRTATFEVAAGETVRCEFTNVRNTAPLTLTKEWGDAFAGDEVALSAAGDDVLSNGPVGSTSVAPTDGPATSALTVHSDETVTLSETFGPGDIVNYNIALVCTGGQTIDTTNVTIDGQTASYELVFGDDPQPTDCRFQNTIKTTTVVLQKEWIDGKVGDQSALTITSSTSPATDTATSTATGATGAEVDTTNQAVLTNVFVGDVLTLDETLLVGDGNYTYDLVCNGGSLDYDDLDDSGSLTILDTDENNTITCTFTNTRRTATLELTKDWADSPATSDAVELRIGPDGAPLVSTTTTSNVAPAAPISTVVYVGDTYEIAEDALATFDAANYDIDWVCTDAAGSSGSDETTGSVAITPADADATILCTFTNDRLSTPLSFRKEWIDGAEGDTADLTIDPEIVDPATATWAVPVDADPVGTGSGTTSDSYTVTVYAGEDVVLSELLADGNLGGYTVADFDCGAVIPAVGAGTWTVSVDETNTDSAIECVITNERTETTLTLVKDWVDPTTGLGSSVEMTATGQAGEITESSTSPTDSTSDALRVFSGETVDISEVFTTGDGANFSTVLTCLPAVESNVPADQRSADVVVPKTGLEPIECTFENTRLNTLMTLDKDWVNPFEGDRYGLQISGTGNGNGVSTAPAATLDTPVAGSGSASLQVYAGEQVTVTEFALANTGTYTVEGLDCGALTATPVGDGPAATLTLSAADVAAPINCTYTNARTSADFTIAKTWDDPVGGVGIGLTANGTDPLSGSVAESLESPAEGSFDITVYSGETVSFGETFDVPADADLFTTTLVCDGDASANDTPYSGSYVVPADPQDTTCTFDNYRKRTTLTLEKSWVDAVAGDEADLAISATDSDGPITAIAPAGAGTSGDTASITVYAGEQVTLTEALDAGNTAAYDVTDFSCTAGAVTWADGAASATLDVAATDVAAPITCEFENTAQRGNIVIIKNIDGTTDGEFDFAGDWSDDGITTDPADTDPADFSIATDGLTGAVVFNDVLVPKDGSSFSIVETDPTPEYDGTSVDCTSIDPADTSSGGTTTPLTGTIDLDNGETVICTFTNTERSTIVIVKDARPDSAADFGFTGDLGAFTLDDDADGTLSNTFTSDLLNAEAGSTYAVNETSTPGWTLDLGLSACSNGDEFAGSGVVIDPAPGTTVTCTFVNTANPAGLTATKAVQGVEGAWGPFTFTLSGGTFTGDAGQAVDSADPVAQWTDLVEGQTYTIVENEVSGYETGATFACTLIDPNDPENPVTLIDASAAAGFQFVAVAGGVFSCDITNVAIPADVTVAKTVAGVDDTLPWSFDFSITAVSAGAAEPTLDSADTTAEGTGPTTSTDTVDWSGLTPGATYTVAETVPNAGYTSGTLVCTGATDLDDVDETVTFVAPLGGEGVEITCGITNTAIPSEVSVTKTVDGGLDDAQAWAFEFTLSPDANPIGSQDATGTGDGNDTVTWTDLVPGATYELTEVLPGTNTTTYENGVLTCSIGDNETDQSVSFVAPLGGEGVEVTCSVTNTAQSDVSYDKELTSEPVRNADGTWSLSYTLTVENAVDAGAGVYDLSDTFLFGEGVTIVVDSAAVTNTTPGTITTNAAFDGDTDPVIVTGEAIAAGATHTYVVTVDVTIAVGPGTDGDCVREDDGGTGFLNEMTIAIDGGEPETTDACAGFATLTLVKVVVNDDGGNATVADFPLTADGPVTLTGVSGTDAVSSAVPAGSYTLSEDQLVEGYLPSLFLCDAGTGAVTLADGDNATCTITNDDEPVDLEITKNDDGITAIAGGAPFDYTITVQNVGTRDADLGEPVTVVDELPTPLQWVSFPDDCEQAGQTLTCDIDPALMTVGADPVVITVTVRAPADAPSGTYVNKVSVTTEDDPVCEPFGDCEPPPCEEAATTNNVDCEPTPVDRQGAIRIVKTDDVAAGASVLPGQQYDYTLQVTNTGVSTILPGLVVTDDLPAQLSLVSVSGGAGWSCNDVDPIECTYAPSLAPGASAPNITVVVSVNANATGTEIDNTAVVRGAVDRECPEPESGLAEAFVPACNQVTDEDDEVTPLTVLADLAIVKTASVETVGAGGEFNWVLEVENFGPSTALDVEVGDIVPAAVVVTNVSSTFFTCSNVGNDVTCTRPSMAVGARGTITITVSVPATAAGGTVDNLGNVEASTPDPNLDNNSDDASVVVVAQIPPTSVSPTIPATGSNSTEPVLKTALVLLMLGGLGLIAARRRRPDEVTPTV